MIADQVQSLRFALVAALKTIATVKTRSSMDVVRPGTSTDVYSVNATVTQAVQGVGGGGNLNNAYSAIAIVPGTFVPPNQQGWNQAVYIRGGGFDQVGYEFDGVPVNRSLDNYPGGTVGTLGQQELQVYAGGGTASESASGLAGFINQVIKTGTYPGYASVNAGIGTPSYYHSLQLEAGGASPDRLFSYYVGIGGYNQTYRYFDQFNGASLGNAWGVPAIANNTSNLTNLPGVYPTCGFVPPSGRGILRRPERVADLRSVLAAARTTRIRCPSARRSPRSGMLSNDFARLCQLLEYQRSRDDRQPPCTECRTGAMADATTFRYSITTKCCWLRSTAPRMTWGRT